MRFLALATLALTGAGAFAQDVPPAPREVPALPLLLRGIDLDQPAQHAFRGWPTAEMIERPYWFPWSLRAFQRADLLKQPVVLVLTVPWSLPAQRAMTDTFADARVLRVVNDSFLTILVNGDRRPDLRERYRAGTWPAVSLLLPNGMPMLSQANPTGAALPIALGYVQPDGLIFALQEGRLYFDRWDSMLRGLAEAWDERTRPLPPQAGPVRIEASDFMARFLVGNFDAVRGGFEPAPRFVLPGLSEYAAIRAARGLPALDGPARVTLEKTVSSPLRDRREGGFHRIAGAVDWQGIQYEKPLLVQAEFLREGATELRRGESPEILAAVRETSRFLLEVLDRPGGGFFNAQAADARSPDGGGWWAADPVEGATPPPVDRLVLSGPNALAGAALLRASIAAEDPSLVEAGRAALDLVLARGVVEGRGVRHVIEPLPDDRRFLESHAQVAFAFVDAHETTGDPRYLAAAVDVANFALRNLRRGEEPLLRDHLETGAEVGLESSPRWPTLENVRLARALLRLHWLGAGEGLLDRASEIVGAAGADPASIGVRGIDVALAIEEIAREPLVVTVDGDPASPKTRALREAAARTPVPWTVVRAGDRAASPAARLSREGRTLDASDPSGLAAAARSLVPAAAETRAP